MPRNKSEKEPTIEGFDDAVLNVLRTDARHHYQLGRRPQFLLDRQCFLATDPGTDALVRLSDAQRFQYQSVPFAPKLQFVADYMAYLKELHAT